MEEIKEINKIYFSIASSEEIRSKASYVANVVKYSDNKYGTIYDPNSGSLFNKKCESCNNYEQECPGHFGVIELNEVIVHPLFFNHVFNILKIICHNCSNIILSREHLEFSDLLKFDGERKIVEIINKIKKVSKCFHCNTTRREYKIKKDMFFNIILYDNDVEISDREIKEIFNNITEDSVNLLGISHPKNCCLEVFPVIPPCCRPYEFVGNTIKEDDISKQLVEIIKVNNILATNKDKNIIHNLKLKIETFCRNPKKKSKTINSEPIKGIRERLTGKDGQLRDNLLGKRTEMSARTVIGPGPNLKLDEVGIPSSIANSLTFPVEVYEHNLEEIIAMINSREVEKIKRNEKIIRIDLQIYSDIISFLEINDIVERKKEKILITNDNIKFNFEEGDRIFRDGIDITPEKLPEKKEPDLKVGDIAQRKIRNGDWVLMNRQPTLWKGSMMAFKVVIMPKTKTFTFNLAVCKAFNSDFDGDEQNAHFPQSIESSIELRLLSTPEECLCTSANGSPIIVILQDALLGAYLMTLNDSFIISEECFNDLIFSLSKDVNVYLKRKDEIQSEVSTDIKCGRNLISLLLPRDFNFDDSELVVKNGIILKGTLTKKYLGSSKSSFIYLLKQEYDNETCVNFINDIQFMTNKWLLHHSFSVNISDCYQNEINIQDKLLETDFINRTILNRKLAESKINVVLSNAKDVGMKIAENTDNNFVHTIKSGSKGDYFNLGQVKGLLGQQIINGKRIEKMVDNNSRTLIHYPKNSLTLEQEYESRGFIMNSFYNGLNPREFFFHSMSGRQGVCDTAMTTFMSGYNMRKLVKLTEDIKINNNGLVTDSSNNILSYAYGDTGLNPENKHIDICRILERINRKN